ncbi:MAG: hypothetical protein FK734_00850, partial [Asgard group archaeon]|nr:hypothetical protein [Asgard group archaeon]
MNKIIDNDVILTKLSPLLEMEFILNLSGNKERSDFLYQSNKGEHNEIIIWNGEKRVLTDKLSSTLMVIHPTKPIIAYIQDTNGNEDYYLLKYDY